MTRIILFAMTTLLPLAAWADEVEEHGTPHIPWAKIAFSTINFAIFLFIVFKLGRPAVPDFFASRRQQIAEALTKADEAKREAEVLRAEWQRRLDGLGAELEALLKQARADIAVERDQILAAAKQAAETIRRDAQRTAESELRNAQDALRAEVAKQALGLAERMATQRLTASDQQRFVREFVAQVEQA